MQVDISTSNPQLAILGAKGSPREIAVISDSNPGDSCGKYLTSRWSPCNASTITGEGLVTVELTCPTKPVLPTLPSCDLTCPGNAASFAPINVPIDVLISTDLEFVDGKKRAVNGVIRITKGSDVCEVFTALNGQPRLRTKPGFICKPSECQVTVSWPQFTESCNVDLSATGTARVVVAEGIKLHMAHYDVTSLPSTRPLDRGSFKNGSSITLRQLCTTSDFQQQTLWTTAKLSERCNPLDAEGMFHRTAMPYLCFEN